MYVVDSLVVQGSLDSVL